MVGMLDDAEEIEYKHILESIDPKYFFERSICFDPVLIKKAGKDVASHRYRELKVAYKKRYGVGYAEKLIYEFLKLAPSGNDKRESLTHETVFQKLTLPSG